MATAKAALDSLQVAYTQYRQSKSVLEKYLKATSKMNAPCLPSLENSFTEINKWHTIWVSKAALSEEILMTEEHKFNTPWLENLWKE